MNLIDRTPFKRYIQHALQTPRLCALNVRQLNHNDIRTVHTNASFLTARLAFYAESAALSSAKSAGLSLNIRLYNFL